MAASRHIGFFKSKSVPGEMLLATNPNPNPNPCVPGGRYPGWYFKGRCPEVDVWGQIPTPTWTVQPGWSGSCQDKPACKISTSTVTCSSKFIVRTHAHTHRRPTALCGPPNKNRLAEIRVLVLRVNCSVWQRQAVRGRSDSWDGLAVSSSASCLRLMLSYTHSFPGPPRARKPRDGE